MKKRRKVKYDLLMKERKLKRHDHSKPYIRGRKWEITLNELTFFKRNLEDIIIFAVSKLVCKIWNTYVVCLTWPEMFILIQLYLQLPSSIIDGMRYLFLLLCVCVLSFIVIWQNYADFVSSAFYAYSSPHRTKFPIISSCRLNEERY